MKLNDLLRGKPAESFSPEQLQNKAQWRWQRDQFYAAFLLFDAAYQRALETRRRVDMATSRNRAAVTLFLSGEDPDEAVRTVARLQKELDAARAALALAKRQEVLHATERQRLADKERLRLAETEGQRRMYFTPRSAQAHQAANQEKGRATGGGKA